MLIINSQKISVRKPMREALEEKLGFLGKSNDARILVERENKLIKLSIAFADKFNHHYYISTKGEDFFEVVDSMKDKCNRELRDYSKKVKTNKIVSTKAYDENDEIIIDKEKVIIADEISYDQAVREMEELGHNWYVFRDEDDGEISIVYKRYSDGYGLVKVK